MTGFAPSYSASIAVFGTNDLDGLASSSTLLTGRESPVLTNTYNDVLLSGRFKANNTAPTAGQISIYVGTMINDSSYPDVFDGTGSGETITSEGIRDAILIPVKTIITDATPNRVYEFSQVNLPYFFGGAMPDKYFIYVAHTMVQPLNTTAGTGGQCWIKGINYPA